MLSVKGPFGWGIDKVPDNRGHRVAWLLRGFGRSVLIGRYGSVNESTCVCGRTDCGSTCVCDCDVRCEDECNS